MAMRKLTAANPNAVLLFLNQTREKIGIMFGDPTTTPGGRALEFYTSQRLRLKLGAKIRDEQTKRVIGQEVRALAEKDKTGSPFGQITFTFDFKNSRVDKGEELLAIGLLEELIVKEAKRYQFVGDNYTRRALLRYLRIRAVEEEFIAGLGLTLLD
jgi:RecA/RadA recombinase